MEDFFYKRLCLIAEDFLYRISHGIRQEDRISFNLPIWFIICESFFFLKLDKIFYQTNIEASATILIQYFNLNLSNR